MATPAEATKRAYKQDLPPKGGYAPFNYKRIPAKKMYTAPILFGGFILWEIYAHWKWRRSMRIINSEETEARSTQFALEPMMLAERDRVYIKQLKKNRDDEEKLMKGVEGWEVGTYYGIKMYNDPDINKYPLMNWNEYYAHCRPAAADAEFRHREWWVS